MIEVSLETFATRGFTAATMEEIATAAGVTKPLLYQHFASKRALYLELIDDVTTRLLAALGEAAAGASSARARVEAGMRAYFRFAVENQAAVRMLYHAPQDDELARGLRSLEVAIADFLSPLIDADIDEEHRRTIAVAVVGMTEAVTREWLAHRQEARSGSYGALADGAASSNDEAMALAERVADLAWSGLRGVGRPQR